MLVNKDGRIKLTDFGLSTDKETSTLKKYHPNSEQQPSEEPFILKILGTADYMAPEILDVSRTEETDEMVDWWAVGIIAFEFVTGGLPFNAKTKEEVFSNIKAHRIKWPSSEVMSKVNPSLIKLIESLLNPDPKV